MSQYLPSGHFYWVDEAGWAQMDWQATSPTDPFGYIVECDLEYPAELHDLHNDYPLAAERVQIEVEMLSDTQVEISRHYARARLGKNVKLVTNLMTKTKYVVHSANLKFYLDHCLRLTKIHRVIRFAQSPWMASYIEMNTAMRAAAQNEMERDFPKLMNNAVYGKTCEHQGKHNDIRLLTDHEKIAKLVSKPHCMNVGTFDRNLIGVELRKVKQIISKPSYVGFAVLELSKLHMLRCGPLPFICCLSFSVFDHISSNAICDIMIMWYHFFKISL